MSQLLLQSHTNTVDERDALAERFIKKGYTKSFQVELPGETARFQYDSTTTKTSILFAVNDFKMNHKHIEARYRLAQKLAKKKKTLTQ
jgi:hypothetical protein